MAADASLAISIAYNPNQTDFDHATFPANSNGGGSVPASDTFALVGAGPLSLIASHHFAK